ncbi:MAG TPA: response regulator [Myxococcales bacterium]|nr:response regulator [Myxococcales bacterium]
MMPARDKSRAAASRRPARKVKVKLKAKASASAALAARSARSGALVLVVDDYEDAREMYAEYLTYSGFRVAEARTGVEALEKAYELLPDLILMDLSLPVMDGWEATRRLKADARTRSIPVVALTGHALAGHSEGAKKAGCDAFVTKPCLPDALVMEVKKVLERSRAEATGKSKARG